MQQSDTFIVQNNTLIKINSTFVNFRQFMKHLLALYFLLAAALLNAQTSLVLEGQSYTNSEDTWLGVNIARTKPTALIFRNNSITSVNRYGYLLCAGDETPGAYNKNLDGAVITGNYLTWNGKPEQGIIPHGLFTGYNINVHIKYNYLNRVPMAIIRKSDGMTDVSGAVAYNIIKDPGVGVVIKGMNGVRIYNNTFYSSLTPSETNRALIDIYENPSVTPAGSAKNTKIFNNIFYTKHNIRNISISSTCLSGFESDYNVFYCESGTPTFVVNGVTKTFSEWQAMGYDKHSLVINPGFKDLTTFVPAERLDYGTNLGSVLAEGLSVNAKWGKTSPETAMQNGKWQVGAIIYKEVAVPDPPSAPVFTGATISDAAPAQLVMSFSLPLAGSTPASTAFSVMVAGNSRTVNSVTVSGSKVTLTLASPVKYGEAVTVAYTRPSSNPLQTPQGGVAETFTAKSVTNNVAAPVPVFSSAVIENAAPAQLAVTFSLPLAGTTPASTAFSVMVAGNNRTVNSVAVSGSKVTLTLASPVKYGEAVTVAYTRPSSNSLQTPQGGVAETFTAKSVTNNVAAPANKPPTITIASPTKSTAYIAPADITIEATASDSDGTVAKVEFFNGTVKIGERTSAPWVFTWKQVTEGTYTITATATDNANASTRSEAVAIVVEKAAPAMNLAPTVAINPPDQGVIYEAPAKVALTAMASDQDGMVTRVEYYIGDHKIGESNTSPFTVTFSTDSAGTYNITAIAWDDLNASATSEVITITVRDRRYYADLVNLYPSPNNGRFTVEINPLPDNDKEIRLDILTMAGLNVWAGILEAGETRITVEMGEAAPGLYILRVTNGVEILTTRRFIRY